MANTTTDASPHFPGLLRPPVHKTLFTGKAIRLHSRIQFQNLVSEIADQNPHTANRQKLNPTNLVSKHRKAEPEGVADIRSLKSE